MPDDGLMFFTVSARNYFAAALLLGRSIRDTALRLTAIMGVGRVERIINALSTRVCGIRRELIDSRARPRSRQNVDPTAMAVHPYEQSRPR